MFMGEPEIAVLTVLQICRLQDAHTMMTCISVQNLLGQAMGSRMGELFELTLTGYLMHSMLAC